MRILAFPDLKAQKGIGHSRRHLARLVAAGKFPPPIHLSENRIGWPEDEIDGYLAARITERDRALARQAADAPASAV